MFLHGVWGSGSFSKTFRQRFRGVPWIPPYKSVSGISPAFVPMAICSIPKPVAGKIAIAVLLRALACHHTCLNSSMHASSVPLIYMYCQCVCLHV